MMTLKLIPRITVLSLNGGNFLKPYQRSLNSHAKKSSLNIEPTFSRCQEQEYINSEHSQLYLEFFKLSRIAV